DPPVRVLPVDPQSVEIVAGRIALDRDEMRAAVIRAQLDGVLNPQLVGIPRVHRELPEIPAAVPDALVARNLRPGRAASFRTIQAASRRLVAVDQRVDAVRFRRARRKANACRGRGKAMAGEVLPGPAAVCR